MNKYFITFRSVTYAQRGESALRSTGIRCVLGRAPRIMEERGCGYSLSLQHGDLYRGLETLKARQVPYRKVYARWDNGDLKEVEL